MKLVAAVAVLLAFAAVIAIGIVQAVANGSLWLLFLGVGAFLFAFVKAGCLHHS